MFCTARDERCQKKAREKASVWVATVHAGGIGRLLPAPGLENLPMAVHWLRGRDHNLYNGLAKVYPESRFCEKTGWRMEGNRPFPFVAARYGRCIIIAPRPPSPVYLLLAPPSRLHFIHNVPAYEPAQSRIRR